MTSRVAAASGLALLGLLHVYWAAGGKWGTSAIVPTRDGKPVLHPTPLTAAIVAAGLFTLSGAVPAKIATWPIAGIFFLRAPGDFRYAGFFKRVRGTRFAELDTKLYSPLCLLLAVLAGRASRS